MHNVAVQGIEDSKALIKENIKLRKENSKLRDCVGLAKGMIGYVNSGDDFQKWNETLKELEGRE